MKIIYERMHFTDAQMAELKKTAYNEYDILHVDGCKEIAKKYHGQFR